LSYNANPLRSAAPVAPYLVRYRIQHSNCLLSCGLLNVVSSFRLFSSPSTITMLHCLCLQAQTL